MSVEHDEVELEDLKYDPESNKLTYDCPCGDVFEITPEEILDGETVANCGSCSLYITVALDEATLLEVLEKLTNKSFKPKQTIKATN